MSSTVHAHGRHPASPSSTQAFHPERLEVIDESESHRGHGGWREGGETHFRVVMRAESLDGLSRVERSRAVHKVAGGGARCRRPRPGARPRAVAGAVGGAQVGGAGPRVQGRAASLTPSAGPSFGPGRSGVGGSAPVSPARGSALQLRLAVAQARLHPLHGRALRGERHRHRLAGRRRPAPRGPCAPPPAAAPAPRGRAGRRAPTAPPRCRRGTSHPAPRPAGARRGHIPSPAAPPR